MLSSNFQLEVSSQKIDMIKSLLDGANIHNCGDTNEIAVSELIFVNFIPRLTHSKYSTA